MKKYIKILIIIFTIINLLSCESWLDVKPKTTVKGKDLLADEEGFKNALTGCYMNMTSSSLYGKELTFGFLEIIINQFSVGSYSSYRYPYYHRYESQNSLPYIQGIWDKFYKTIANVNYILDNIDKNSTKLPKFSYQIIKGEALALRGFLHFELLKLFGSGNWANDPTALEKPSIVYKSSLNANIQQVIKTKDVIKFIKSDLLEAYNLLRYADPDSKHINKQEYTLYNDDGFFNKRKFRLNYYAVNGILSRLYLWLGNYTEGYKYAKEALDFSRLKWVVSYNIEDYWNEDRSDYKFKDEHIFSLDIKNLIENAKPYFYDVNNKSLLYLTTSKLNQIYEKGGGFSIADSDYRYKDLINKANSKKILKKYLYLEGNPENTTMPILKMSEMYLVMCECLIRDKSNAKNKENALKEFDLYRSKRGIRNKLDPSISDEDFLTEIYKEYKKEFLGEGKVFYLHKRLNFNKIMGSFTEMNDEKYILPIPKSETDY